MMNNIISHIIKYVTRILANSISHALSRALSLCVYTYIINISLYSAEKGPIAYWPLEDKGGNLVKDLSPNKNTGEKFGILSVEGKLGNAYLFDGKNDYINCGNIPSLNSINSLTIEAWIKPSQNAILSNTISPIVGKDIKNNRYSFLLWVNKGFLKFSAYDSKILFTVTDKDVLSANEWTYIAATFDGENAYLYKNGNLKQTVSYSGTLPISDADVIIGKYGNSFWDGAIDNVKIYNKVLTEESIMENYLADYELSQVTSLKSEVVEIKKIDSNASDYKKAVDDAWAKAQTLELKKTNNLNVKKETYVSIIYDNNCIFFRFKCIEPNIKQLKRNRTLRDDIIYSDDCIEIFIATTKNDNYFHFIQNTLGTQQDEICYSYPIFKCNKAWDATWNCRIVEDKESWATEITIPFKSLGIRTPPDGTSWKISLNREEKQLNENTGWPNGYFHRPEKFGTLIFNSYKENIKAQIKELDNKRAKVQKLWEIFNGYKDDIIGEKDPSDILKKVITYISELNRTTESHTTKISWANISNDICKYSLDLKKLEVLLNGNIFLHKLKNCNYDQKDLLEEFNKLENDNEHIIFQGKKYLFTNIKSEICRVIAKEHSYFIWKKNPWENLPAETWMPQNLTECKEINLAMGINEHTSTSFCMTNLTKNNMQVSIDIKDRDFPITVRYGYPIKAANGQIVNDALPLLQTINIPPLQSREIWLTLNSKGQKPGNKEIKISLIPQDYQPHTITLKAKIYPLELPTHDIPLYSFVFDYTTSTNSEDPDLWQAIRKDLIDHYITCPYIEYKAIPFPTSFKSIKEGIDFRKCDKAIDLWLRESPKPKILGFYLGFRGGRYKLFGQKYLSDEWKNNFSIWLDQFINYLQKKGLTYDDFFFHIWDENTTQEHQNLLAFIKKTKPQLKTIVLFEEMATLDEVIKIEPYADIFCPYWYAFKNNYNILNEAKKKNNFFWIYLNPITKPRKLASPYKEFRLSPWYAYTVNAGGCGVWVYLREPRKSWQDISSELNNKDGCNDIVYLSKYAPSDVPKNEVVIPSKRWEAWREGIEDYLYLKLLDTLIKKSTQGGIDHNILEEANKVRTISISQVLENQENFEFANMARENIIQMIIKLKQYNSSKSSK